MHVSGVRCGAAGLLLAGVVSACGGGSNGASPATSATAASPASSAPPAVEDRMVDIGGTDQQAVLDAVEKVAGS